MIDQHAFIKTCPLGNGFHMPAQQAWNALYVYYFYQLVLSGSFFVLFVSNTGPSLFGNHSSALFYSASLSYFAITLFSSVFLINRLMPFSPQAQLRVLLEIGVLTCLMHASGGITSGLGVLLMVSVAAGGILAGGQCALLFATFATFAILGEQLYSDYYDIFSKTAYTYAGVLSTSFFAISGLALVLARRAEQSEQIARERSLDVRNLEAMNQYIIRHMQSGVIVISQEGRIRLINQAASQLLGIKHSILSLLISDVSLECWEYVKKWRENPNENAATLSRDESSHRTYLQFQSIGSGNNLADIIFLEDLSRMDERIQQSKLASLGRLTASIAHEIRNPLGAISHASQLLGESEHLPSQDRRLLEIIDNHSARVNGIVKSILDLSRRENALKEIFPLAPWMEKFEDQFIQECGLIQSPFRWSATATELKIAFDRNHLNQILSNLCMNALKHGQVTPEKPTIFIRISEDNASGHITIEVRDEGKGISPDNADSIFEPFFTTSGSGTGLGLYLARELAELNQSRLSYHPQPQGGSSFRLRITRNTLLTKDPMLNES